MPDVIWPLESRGAPYGFAFTCPGCGDIHAIPTHGPKAWGFNGDLEKPTFTPSILARLPMPDRVHVCHSFVRDGQIQFLSDSTHALAGQTVALAPVELPTEPQQEPPCSRS